MRVFPSIAFALCILAVGVAIGQKPQGTSTMGQIRDIGEALDRAATAVNEVVQPAGAEVATELQPLQPATSPSASTPAVEPGTDVAPAEEPASEAGQEEERQAPPAPQPETQPEPSGPVLGNPPPCTIDPLGLAEDPESPAEKQARHQRYAPRPEVLNDLEAWEDWKGDWQARQFAFEKRAVKGTKTDARRRANEDIWQAVSDAELDAEARRQHRLLRLETAADRENDLDWQRKWGNVYIADPWE